MVIFITLLLTAIYNQEFREFKPFWNHIVISHEDIPIGMSIVYQRKSSFLSFHFDISINRELGHAMNLIVTKREKTRDSF